MGMPDGAHTHGGGGFDPVPIAVVILAVAVASGVASAVAALTWLLLVTLCVVAMAGIVIAVLVVRYRLRHPRVALGQLEQRNEFRAQIGLGPLEPPVTRSAIGAPQQHHVHFHGITAEDVAAILRQQGGRP